MAERNQNETRKRPVFNFSDLIEKLDEPVDDMPFLPLCHTTKWTDLGKVMQEGCLKPTKRDENFDQYLLFFFYGRARYIPQKDLEDVYKQENPPVALLYQYEKMPPAERIMPFDSGGFDKYDIEETQLRDFIVAVRPDNGEIKKFIKQVYLENANYLKKEIKIDHQRYPWCTPLRHLVRLHGDRHNTKYGERAYTLEIQFAEKVLSYPAAVVLPAEYLTHPEGRQEILSAFGFEEKDIAYEASDYKKGEYRGKKLIGYSPSEIARTYYKIINIVEKIVEEMEEVNCNSR